MPNPEVELRKAQAELRLALSGRLTVTPERIQHLWAEISNLSLYLGVSPDITYVLNHPEKVADAEDNVPEGKGELYQLITLVINYCFSNVMRRPGLARMDQRLMLPLVSLIAATIFLSSIMVSVEVGKRGEQPQFDFDNLDIAAMICGDYNEC